MLNEDYTKKQLTQHKVKKVKSVIKAITPPVIYYCAHKVKKALQPIPVIGEPMIDEPVINVHVIAESVIDEPVIDEPVIDENIYRFVEQNVKTFENGRFVIFPDDDHAHKLITVIKKRRLFDCDRFKILNIKDEAIIAGNFGNKSDYDNAIVIFTGENRCFLENFLRWYRDFDTKKLMSLNTSLLLGEAARLKVLEYPFKTMLDVGCGHGLQAKQFADLGYQVTGITYPVVGGSTGAIIENNERVRLIIGDYLSLEIKEKFDLVWASHIMEHMENVPQFIRKLKENVKPGGIIAIIVPNNEAYIDLMHPQGHMHRFNAGFVLRHLVFAGIDCRNTKVLADGYNLNIVIPNVSFFTYESVSEVPEHFPPDMEKAIFNGHTLYNGDVTELNWN